MFSSRSGKPEQWWLDLLHEGQVVSSRSSKPEQWCLDLLHEGKVGNRAAGSAPGLENLSNGGSDLLHEGQVVSSRSGLANLGNGG